MLVAAVAPVVALAVGFELDVIPVLLGEEGVLFGATDRLLLNALLIVLCVLAVNPLGERVSRLVHNHDIRAPRKPLWAMVIPA